MTPPLLSFQPENPDDIEARQGVMTRSIQYDTRLVAVSKAIQCVEPPGNFCSIGARAAYPPPGLVIDGVGDVLLPLADTAAKALIVASRLVSSDHAWELSTDQFKIDNPAFNAFVKDQITEACRTPLGIHARVEFEAKLYKLLLYEPGGKFDRHQDSEKESGMFGTLVVVLPGRFEGGELVVHHPSAAGQKEKTKSETTKSDVVQVEDTRVFDAGAMDPFMIKYAAFYGDCPHEVKAVTKGYRLCLTYNLVKIASSSPMPSLSDPHFGSNHELYATLKSALENFFSADGVENKKRQRVDTDGSSSPMGFDVTDPDSYRPCKLVYVLTHKYTDANLSFENLTNRDEAVAASLARFCDSSDGALGLYLCKMEYRFEWHGQEGTMYVSDGEAYEPISSDAMDGDGDGNEVIPSSGRTKRKLALYHPWVRYEDGACEKTWLREYCEGDLANDVTPCAFFRAKGFKFDCKTYSDNPGDDGASANHWYSSAALVVLPLALSAKWTVQHQRDPSELLVLCAQVAASKPAHARAIASAFQGCIFHCTTTSPAGVGILDAAAKIDDFGLVCSVVAGFRRHIDFQPKLRDVVGRFGAAKVLNAIDDEIHGFYKYRSRNAVNLVASVLDGVTDGTTIAATFNTLRDHRFMERAVSDLKDMQDLGIEFDDEEDPEPDDYDSTPEEFARVLKLLSLVSHDRAKTVVSGNDTRRLILIIFPAIRLLLEQLDMTNGCVDERTRVLAIANCALALLKTKLPMIRTSPYAGGFGCAERACGLCTGLRAFLKSHAEVATFSEAGFESHLEDALGEFLEYFSVEQNIGGGGRSIVVLKKTFESPMLKKAQQEITKLSELVTKFAGSSNDSTDDCQK